MLSRFTQLDKMLSKTSHFWQFSAFHCRQYPWEKAFPKLSYWLNQLTLSDIERLKKDPEACLEEIAFYYPELNALLKQLSLLCDIPLLFGKEHRYPIGMNSGINGRKWEQITRLGSLSHEFYHPENEWLEWCGGKGYLGRLLHTISNTPVTTLEWQQTLCDVGQDYADHHHLSMTFLQRDALSKKNSELIKKNQHAVALHACGDLHLHLMKIGVHHNIDALTIAPCCFHLTESNVYQPLSTIAQQSCLQLAKRDLRLPLQETVTGGQRVQSHRQQEMIFRLGFNELQKSLTYSQQYLSVPSIKKSLLSEGFTFFCHWAAEHKHLDLPSDINYAQWEEKGKEAFLFMERCDVIQHLFKRPLELWLCLDRALYLEESGYEVRIGKFCTKQQTPRNIVIQAKRRGSDK